MTSNPRRKSRRHKEENRRHFAAFFPSLHRQWFNNKRTIKKHICLYIRASLSWKSAHHKLAHRAPSRSFMFLNCRVLLLWRYPFPLAEPRAHGDALGSAARGRGGRWHTPPPPPTHTHTHTHTHKHSQSSQRWKWPPTVKTFRLLSSAPQRRVGLSVCRPDALVKQ